MNTAYNHGKQAFLDGKNIDSNPYKYPSADWTYWWDGWHDAATGLEG